MKSKMSASSVITYSLSGSGPNVVGHVSLIMLHPPDESEHDPEPSLSEPLLITGAGAGAGAGAG